MRSYYFFTYIHKEVANFDTKLFITMEKHGVFTRLSIQNEANWLISIEILRVFSFIAQSLAILIQTDEANLLISIQIPRKFFSFIAQSLWTLIQMK